MKKGILEQIKAAGSLKKVDTLETKLAGYANASRKTLRRGRRLIERKRRELEE